MNEKGKKEKEEEKGNDGEGLIEEDLGCFQHLVDGPCFQIFKTKNNFLAFIPFSSLPF